MREIAALSASIDGMKGLDNEKGSSSRNVTASLKFSKWRSDKHPNAIESFQKRGPVSRPWFDSEERFRTFG
jgi:hypothetical protein